MNFNINLKSFSDLDFIKDFPVSSVLLQTKLFSRTGNIEIEEIAEILPELQLRNIRCVLAWDIVAKDEEIDNHLVLLNPLVKKCNTIRVLDPGIALALKENFSNIEIEFSFEHSGLNHISVVEWLNSLGSTVKKVILSGQTPIPDLKEICSYLSIETEVLGYGPIEIFYSRRRLLEGIENEPDLKLASRDRPSQLNPVICKALGTTVFYDKYLNILPFMNELEAIGIDWIRFEYLTLNDLQIIRELLTTRKNSAFSSSEGFDETKGFITQNTTDELFKKLTNAHLSGSIEKKIGVILESAKNRFCIVRLDEPMTLPKSLRLISPEGYDLKFTLSSVHNLMGDQIKSHITPGVYRIEWLKYAVTGSLIVEH